MTARITYVADAFKLLSVWDESIYDVTYTDPPFPEHVQKNLCSGSLVGTKNVPKYDLPFAALAGYGFVGDLLRITRRWVVIHCAIESLGDLKRAYPAEYVRGCVWYKPNSMGQLTRDRPATSYEGIALLHKPGVKKRWNGAGSYGIFKCNGTRGKKDRHLNEKPLALAQKMAALFSERGEEIFDPFCGSGAIGEAAVSLGRGYVGWDFDIQWVTRANTRLSKPTADLGDLDALALCRMNGENNGQPSR